MERNAHHLGEWIEIGQNNTKKKPVSVHLPGRDLLQHREVFRQRVHGAGEYGRRGGNADQRVAVSCGRAGADTELLAGGAAGKPVERAVLAGHVGESAHHQAVGRGLGAVGVRADGVCEAGGERHRQGLQTV